jgi:hypothetical protein
MTAVGVARGAAPFVRGFDCLAPVPGYVARQMYADGYRFAGRYLDAGPNALTIDERDALFAAGLAIVPITLATTGVPLTQELGHSRGAFTVHKADALYMPREVHITIDLEAVHEGSDVAGFVNAFTSELTAAGYGAMLYVGAGQPLAGHELYELAPGRYWRSGSRVPEPDCGYCMYQLPPLDQTICGQRVDVDVTCCDFRSRTPTFWMPA